MRRHGAEDFWFSVPFRGIRAPWPSGLWLIHQQRKRLGYKLLWKCTSCMIILYPRLNGVHPILYLVNMSHLIRVCACLSCVSPTWASRESTVWPGQCGTSHWMCMSALMPHTWKVYPLVRLAHLGPVCDDGEHLVFLRHASDSSRSRMTERHGGSKSMKHWAEGSLEETVIHMHTSPTTGLSNVACLPQLSECLLQPYA